MPVCTPPHASTSTSWGLLIKHGALKHLNVSGKSLDVREQIPDCLYALRNCHDPGVLLMSETKDSFIFRSVPDLSKVSRSIMVIFIKGLTSPTTLPSNLKTPSVLGATQITS